MTGTVVIHGAATIITGRPHSSRADGDAVLVDEGVITAIGSLDDVHPGGSVSLVDVHGATLVPGLIDPHTHPVVGDFTPRQSTLGWVTNYVHGGVTSLVSAGEAHWPGRPRSAVGAKSLAITACQSALNLRPGGAKVTAGALLLERGLTDEDFEEMHAAGVRLLGEIGLGAVVDTDEAGPLVASARSRGWTVPMHIGGASVPGSHVLGARAAIELQPDVASHCNGGPTARPLAEIEAIIDQTHAAIEVVQAGNIRALGDIVQMLRKKNALDRLQIGTDTPSGTGVIPLGMLRTVAYCSAIGGLDPDIALCCATGQTAARYSLPVGVIEPGRPGDLIAIHAPVGGTASTALDSLRVGDTPGISLVVIDGEVVVKRSRMTPPPLEPATMGRSAGA